MAKKEVARKEEVQAIESEPEEVDALFDDLESSEL